MQNVSGSMPYMVLPGNHESECHSPHCIAVPSKAHALQNFSAYNTRFNMPYSASKSKSNMW
jgi:hypothetical protein